MTAFWAAEARFDWWSYVQSKGGVRAIHGRKDEYLMECPICGKVKLAVNVAKRRWRCFTCGDAGRDAASLVSRVERVPFHQALVNVMSGHRASIGRIDKIEAAVGLEEPEQPFRPKVVPYPAGFRALYPTTDQPQAKGRDVAEAVAYCQSRDIPEYAVECMKLGVCVSGPFRGRLVFPAFDSGGRLIFYQGRAMWAPRPNELRHIKTLSPRHNEGQAGPSDCLLNLQYVADHVETDRVLITEGPIDCAHAWPDAVATWGKKISPRQMELLVRAGIKAIDLCWDADATADAMRAAPGLADLFEVRIVRLPDGCDPGDMTKEQLEWYREQAIHWGTGDRLARI